MSLVKDSLIVEIKAHILNSLEFRKKVDTATTSVKRKYYQRKLVVSNKEAADLLMALDRLDKKNESLISEGRADTQGQLLLPAVEQPST